MINLVIVSNVCTRGKKVNFCVLLARKSDPDPSFHLNNCYQPGKAAANVFGISTNFFVFAAFAAVDR